jgi:hypothetical protein
VAVDPAHLYWANSLTDTIGRANLDGTGVNQSFVRGAGLSCGLAVDGAHLYWANGLSNTIGRANLDGTGVNQSFIIGAHAPCGVAVDQANLYWTNGDDGTIGRANLDGSGPNQSFIGGGLRPCGVAVDARPSPAAPPTTTPPSNQFSAEQTAAEPEEGHRGAVRDPPGPGPAGSLGQRGELCPSPRREDAGRRAAADQGDREESRKLNRTGKVTVKPRITYTPDGGDPGSRSTKLTLRRR